jgi:hypothetical protein
LIEQGARVTIILGLLALVGSVALMGLKREWKLATWSVVFVAGGWILGGLAELRTLQTPSIEADYLRHADVHRQAVLALALSIEAVFAAIVLAVVGWRAGRTSSALALWLSSLWAGVLLALTS